MENAVNSDRPMAGSAALACLNCRRLKMRCIGCENPPCVRCSKSGKECVVQPSRRGVQKASTSTTGSKRKRNANGARDRLNLSDQRIPDLPSRSPGNLSDQRGQHGSPSDPGSNGSNEPPHAIYSMSAMGALKISDSNGAAFESPPARLGYPASDSATPPNAHVSDQTLEDLVRFFRKKLVYFIPVLDESDLDDPRFVVQERRPLAYATALVASNFVPDAVSFRQRLIPRVSDFLAKLEGPLEVDENIIWTELLACGILYAYGPSMDITENPANESPSLRRLNHWKMKSTVENLAMRLDLHHALDHLRLTIRRGNESVEGTFVFNKAMFWLWLFNLSHHFSLVTEAPPTIRQDNSIRRACDLLRFISKPARITRMLAEVDLCVLWSLADRSMPGLGEWWCSAPGEIDPREASNLLDDADAALNVWSRRWGVHGEPDATYPGLDLPNNGAVMFHFRSTRFWMRAFATRILHHQLQLKPDKDPSLEAINADLTIRSAEAAEQACRYLLDIGPIKRDIARYMADFGFALIAFCAIYVVRIYELYGNSYPVLGSYIGTAEASGKILIEMAVGNNQIPRIYGEKVLNRLAHAVPRIVPESVEDDPGKALQFVRNDLW